MTAWSSQKICITRVPQSFQQLHIFFIDAEDNCTKKLWSFVKAGDLIKPLDQLTTRGKLTDSLSKANVFADYFSSVYAQDNSSTIKNEPLPDIQQIHIHLEGVIQPAVIT